MARNVKGLQARGWSVQRIIAASNGAVSKSTVYRWAAGEWDRNKKGVLQFPKGPQVEGFCLAVGVDPAEAWAILWPGEDTPRKPTPPLTPDPDFELLQRRLQDPNIAEKEKLVIRETIRMLADRLPRDTDKRRK